MFLPCFFVRESLMDATKNMVRMTASWVVGTSLLLILLFQFSNPILADEPAKEKIKYKISGDVYHGDKAKFSKPCVVDRKKVFEKIPSYIKIKRENLDKSSARYFFLIKEANKAFNKAVKEKAEELGYDLVVEKGEIKAKGVKIPNITKKVLETFEK